MNQLTKTVLEIQTMEKGTDQYNDLFNDIFTGVHKIIDAVVESFAYSLKGDVHAGVSEAYTQLLKSIESYKYDGHEFSTYYNRSLRNRMVDLVRHINTAKMKQDTSYDVSLSYVAEDKDGSNYLVEDRFVDKQLQVHDEYHLEDEITLEFVFRKFSEEKPEQARVIETIMFYSAEGYSKKDMTSALAKLYGAEKYNGTVQKRVSRCRETFKTFAESVGYRISV